MSLWAVIYSISLAVVILLKDVEFVCTLVLIFVVDFSDLLFMKMLSSVVFDDKSDCIVDESWALGLQPSFENLESFQDVDKGLLLDHR